jgi:hypothetical protein
LQKKPLKVAKSKKGPLTDEDKAFIAKKRADDRAAKEYVLQSLF